MEAQGLDQSTGLGPTLMTLMSSWINDWDTKIWENGYDFVIHWF